MFAITSSGGVIRTSAGEVKLSGRQTMGVQLMNLASGDSVVAIARNAESTAEAAAEVGVDEVSTEEGEDDPDNQGSLGDPGSTEPGTEPGNAGPDLTGDDS